MNRAGWVLLLGLLLGLAFPLHADAAERVYALVVGNNVPPPPPEGDGLSALQFADDDALRYVDLLGRFADDVRLLTVLDAKTRRRFPDVATNGPPSLAKVRTQLAELNAMAAAALDAGESVTFFVVFSGHGALDAHGEAFLSLLDGSLSRRVLYDEVLGPLVADRVHVIIDACHAAGVVGLRGKGGFGKAVDASVSAVPEADARDWVATRTLERFPHVGVLAAATAGEQAHEWSEVESGIFSHEVLSALWGAGDINGDLVVEYSEVQAFVAAANSRVEDPRARPTVVAQAIAADPHAPLVDLGRLERVAQVTGEGADLGRFSVQLADGRRHLDANVGSGRVTVAIPEGATAYLRTATGELQLSPHAGERIALAGRTRLPVSDQARGATGAEFRRALFAEPYTPEYYRGFIDSTDAVGVRFARASTPPPTVAAPRLVPAARVDIGPVDTPRRRDRAPKAVQRRRAGIAMATFAGATGATALTLAGVATKTRVEFNAAQTEIEGRRLDSRHRSFAGAAIGIGSAAALLTVAAVVLLTRR